MVGAALIAGVLAGGAAYVAPAQETPRGSGPPHSAAACDLLVPEDIRAVQHAAVKDRKGSSDASRSLQFDQCLFGTEDAVRSVSLTIIRARSSTQAEDPVGSFWRTTFAAPPPAGPERTAGQRQPRRKDPPRPISGIGDDAFWTGDARAGTLYVLVKGVVVRISVGGVQEQEERIHRSVALARAALHNLSRFSPLR